jgi:hypothetical protein
LAFLNPHMESIKDFSTYAVQNGYIGSTDWWYKECQGFPFVLFSFQDWIANG